MDIYQTARLAQQLYAERVPVASERRQYADDRDQGPHRRPAAVRQAVAGLADLVRRLVTKRALAWLRS